MGERTIVEFAKERIEGLRLAIELEELIVAHLAPEVEKLLASTLANPVPYDTRRVRQSSDSKSNIRKWREELAAWQLLANPNLRPVPPVCAGASAQASNQGRPQADAHPLSDGEA